MKKGRHGIKLSVLSEHHLDISISESLFRETSTLGIRKMTVDREELKRKIINFTSSLGTIKIKESYLNGEKITIKPEYDDLKILSRNLNIPIKVLSQQIINEYLSH